MYEMTQNKTKEKEEEKVLILSLFLLIINDEVDNHRQRMIENFVDE
jgi:hypothetical protein